MSSVVSVIMPVYNSERFVGDAIRSVIQQSWPSWELIIVNDGSSDRSAEIIMTFGDPRIRYFEKANGGVSSARNVGLQNMRGEFFCFLDADDIIPETSLSARLEIFRRNEQIAFVDGTVDIYDASLEKKIKPSWSPSFRGNPFLKLIRLDESVFFGLTWMFRIKPGFQYQMDESLTHCEDLFFCMATATEGDYDFTPSVILKYRRNTGSAMSNLNGLARGYATLRRRIRETFYQKTTAIDRLLLNLKTRKIMFLSFANVSMYREAFYYLFTGKV